MTPTAKQLAAGQRRSLKAIQKKLLDMACRWDEVDQYNVSMLEDVSERLEEIARELVDDDAEAK